MAMPDHYPLETAQGRFAIGELPLRGRLRDTAVAMSWERERRPSPDFAATLAREEQAARLAREGALIAYTARLPAGTPPPAPAAPQPTASRVEQQTAPVDSASLENAGNASSRMIDVDAVLAARE